MIGLAPLIPGGAHAHTDTRPTPDTIWAVWEPSAVVAVGLLAAGWLYLRGVHVLWQRAGVGRGVRRWQVWAFLGGLAVTALADLSPLDALGGALFSAHMVQHLLLMLVAPLLIALSRPFLILFWALPGGWRRWLARFQARQPVVGGLRGLVAHWAFAWFAFAGVLWLWHVPALYDAALDSHLLHGIEHAMFFGAAVLFWSCIINAGHRTSLEQGGAVLVLFTTALHSSALGALLTFATTRIYRSYATTTQAWGLTPLEDQQLAGVLMWVPMGMCFTAAALIMVAAWIRAADTRVRHWESRRGDTTAVAPAARWDAGHATDDAVVTGR